MKRDNKKFRVYVDDNFHYQDESYRYILGEFDSYEDAVEASKKIVDNYIDAPSPDGAGMTSEEQLTSYKNFGEDPWIAPEPKGRHFSAWDYAEERCKALCKK